MRRLVPLISGLAGTLAAARVIHRRRARRAAEAPADAPDPRAESLRRRLDQARAVVTEQEEFDGAEVPVDEAEPAPVDPSGLRARIHAEGREKVEAMRRRGGGDAA